MSDKRTTARLQFALGVMERHRAALDAAIEALRRVETTRHRAELAVTAAEEIIAQLSADEEAEFRARLGISDTTAENAVPPDAARASGSSDRE